jgi:hypothetical protein
LEGGGVVVSVKRDGKGGNKKGVFQVCTCYAFTTNEAGLFRPKILEGVGAVRQTFRQCLPFFRRKLVLTATTAATFASTACFLCCFRCSRRGNDFRCSGFWVFGSFLGAARNAIHFTKKVIVL